MMKHPIFLIAMGMGWATAAHAQTDPCLLLPDPGPCEAAIPAWYFDQAFQTCTQFTWGGCGGVVPFETLEDCEAAGCGEDGWSLSSLCDSIAVSPVVIGDAQLGHLEVEVNAVYLTDYWFGYAGFALFREDGQLLAAENVATAPNSFGFNGQLGPQTRYLDYQAGIDLSTAPPAFPWELRLYEGWMAGTPVERCAWNWSNVDVSTIEEASPFMHESPSSGEWFDLMGRPTAPQSGRWLLRRRGNTLDKIAIIE